MTDQESRNTSDMPLPGDNFQLFIQSLAAQGGIALGVIPHPETAKKEVNLDMARYFIDLLTMLDEKTKGNLNEGEQTMMTDLLHQLRMLYVSAEGSSAGTSE